MKHYYHLLVNPARRSSTSKIRELETWEVIAFSILFAFIVGITVWAFWPAKNKDNKPKKTKKKSTLTLMDLNKKIVMTEQEVAMMVLCFVLIFWAGCQLSFWMGRYHETQICPKHIQNYR